MDDNNPQKDTKLCPNCFTENKTSVDFCIKCGRPLGDFVNYDPIKRIWSQGWMYRKSLSEPSSPIVFYGIWALFGLPLIAMLFLLPKVPQVTIPAIIIYGMVLYKVSKNYKRKKER